MAAVGRPTKALALVLLMLCSTQLIVLNHQSDATVLEVKSPFSKSSGESTIVNIAGSGSHGIGPVLEMDANHALQTLTMNLKAGTTYRNTGFEWSDWNQSGFTSVGLDHESDGSLTLGFQGIGWNFDNGTQGWTTSSTQYAQRTTTHNCGMSGQTGASWWTRGGNVYVTSPEVSLSGYSGLFVNAWIRQGNSGCGEEPDNNENFYLQYKNSNNQWIQFQYLAGSTLGGSVTNVHYVLPSDAYHSKFQVRAWQNSGSGTCCDYWFFDDITVPGASGANLTTPSFGWASSSDELLDKGSYPPVYLNAEIPNNSYLNWSVIDANSGNVIPGYENRSGTEIGLSGIDYEVYRSLRLKIHFASNEEGESPRLYNIHGGGKIGQSFSSHNDDWVMQNVTSDSENGTYVGENQSELVSPIFDIDMPFSAVKIQTITNGSPEIFMSLDYSPWHQVNNLGEIIQLERQTSNIRLKYVSSGIAWTVDDLQLQLYPAETIKSPYLDVDNDGRHEWTIKQHGIGSWGNQDVFADNNESIEFQVGFNPTSWHNLFIPQNAKSFEVTLSDVGTVGLGVQNLALWVGNTMIAQVGGTEYVPSLRLSLNESQLDDLNYETENSAAAKLAGQVEFIPAKIEVISDAGTHQLSGLYAPYEAEDTIEATALSELVMSINRLRLNPSKASSMTLDFRADSKCTMYAEVVSMTHSGDVEIGAMTWSNDSSVLIPSSDWREVNTRVQIHQSSAHRIIMNLYSDNHTAMWQIPVDSGGVIKMGDHETIILSESGILHNQSSTIHDLLFKFRTSQSFQDQEDLRIETRLELKNGIVSKPAVKTWSNGAVHNDIVIEDMIITTGDKVIPESNKFLMAEQNITFHIDAGFDIPFGNSKPFPGEYNLSLFRNDELIAFTSDYEGNYWLVETSAPFTSGNITYEAKIAPLSGGDLGSSPVMNRTFEVDPLAPIVTDSNIRFFDHLNPSPNREIRINITDQPVLPTNVTLMLWTEWANDYDKNGWPSEDEYIPRSMANPANLDASVGTYVAVIDDTPAFQGEKVAGYVLGNDPSGHQLLGGGSGNVDDHLFMYQIRNDGVPVVDNDGFEWDGGRRTWLHPGQSYGLNVSFSEVNGISDISEVRIALASNIPSDNMELVWDSTINDCFSNSMHIVVNSCIVIGTTGNAAEPFDQDLMLKLDITPQWSMPDLGDTRREPLVEVIDRAGNLDSALYPQNRWRFSAEMMMPNELDLWVENGALTGNGARVNPSSSMELSGQLYFTKTHEKPQFDCQIEVKVNGVKTHANSMDGNFTASITAPHSSGLHPMTYSIDCMPEQGIDTTSQSEAVLWILVDGDGPTVVEFNSPREESILEPSTHNITVVVSENYGIDEESVRMFWWVTYVGDNNPIHSGSVPMQIKGHENSGLRLEFTGIVDISGISGDILQEQTVLKVRFEGRDQAGNQFSKVQNSENNPAHVWKLVKYEPEFSLERSGIDVSKATIEVEEPVVVQIHIRNDGKKSGEVPLKVEVFDLSGNSEEIASTRFFVDAETVSTYIVDWKPSSSGMQRITVTIDNQTEHTPYIDVDPIQEKGFLEDSIGATNPYILGTTIVMLFIGLISILAWMRFATVKHNELEDEFEYEYEDEFDDI